MLRWPRGETQGEFLDLPVPGMQKIVISPAEKRAAQHQLGWRISLKLSLRKQRRMMNDIAHDVAAAEVCVKDDVQEGIKSL